jgi:hypothetical protein
VGSQLLTKLRRTGTPSTDVTVTSLLLSTKVGDIKDRIQVITVLNPGQQLSQFRTLVSPSRARCHLTQFDNCLGDEEVGLALISTGTCTRSSARVSTGRSTGRTTQRTRDNTGNALGPTGQKLGTALGDALWATAGAGTGLARCKAPSTTR